MRTININIWGPPKAGKTGILDALYYELRQEKLLCNISPAMLRQIAYWVDYEPTDYARDTSTLEPAQFRELLHCLYSPTLEIKIASDAGEDLYSTVNHRDATKENRLATHRGCNPMEVPSRYADDDRIFVAAFNPFLLDADLCYHGLMACCQKLSDSPGPCSNTMRQKIVMSVALLSHQTWRDQDVLKQILSPLKTTLTADIPVSVSRRDGEWDMKILEERVTTNADGSRDFCMYGPDDVTKLLLLVQEVARQLALWHTRTYSYPLQAIAKHILDNSRKACVVLTHGDIGELLPAEVWKTAYTLVFDKILGAGKHPTSRVVVGSKAIDLSNLVEWVELVSAGGDGGDPLALVSEPKGALVRPATAHEIRQESDGCKQLWRWIVDDLLVPNRDQSIRSLDGMVMRPRN